MCEADERALDGLLSESTAPESTEPCGEGLVIVDRLSAAEGEVEEIQQAESEPSIMGGIESVGRSTDSHGEATEPSRPAEAVRSERLLRARRQLSWKRRSRRAGHQAALAQAESQNEAASAQAKARLEATTAQLAETAVEATATAQEERDAVDASTKARSQIHMTLVQTGTALQLTEPEAFATRQRAEVEARHEETSRASVAPLEMVAVQLTEADCSVSASASASAAASTSTSTSASASALNNTTSARLLDARQRLSAARARREAALAQLTETAVEATATAQEAADASPELQLSRVPGRPAPSLASRHRVAVVPSFQSSARVQQRQWLSTAVGPGEGSGWRPNSDDEDNDEESRV